jgi:hypothetical protein
LFGHHGLPAGGFPKISVKHIKCVAGHGIRGDRPFNDKEDYQSQMDIKL